MVGLKKSSNGSWSARKRLPDDVRDEYAALYGPRLKAKFYAALDTKAHDVKRDFGEWLAEVEGRIGAIRAQRNGEDTTLTQRQARAGGRVVRVVHRASSRQRLAEVGGASRRGP
jgi:hypothetical protein